MKNQNEFVKESVEGRQKVAVVTGSSSGIGFATALKLAEDGYHTIATMRNVAKGTDLVKAAGDKRLPVQIEQLDVTDADSIKDFIARIRTSTDRIDVLVNNAGYVLMAALEDLSIKEIQDQLDTNLLGAIRVTQEVLPFMRAQGSGTIVNISSGVGRFGMPGMSAYVATKFALEGLSESLAYEMAPFGIKVILIEPGMVKTKIRDNIVLGRAAMREDSPYSAILNGMNATFESLWETASTSEQVAEVILSAISSPKPKLRYPVGLDVTGWLEKKSTMTDEQFQEYMQGSMAAPLPGQR